MKIHTSFFLCFSILIIKGCSSTDKQDNQIKKVEKLVLTDKYLQFKIDTLTSLVSDYLYFYQDSYQKQDVLLSLNQYNNEIQAFDINTEQSLFKLVIDDEHFNQTGLLMGTALKSVDSIFLFSEVPSTVFLTNKSKSFFKTYDFDNLKEYYGPVVSSAYFNSTPLIYNNKMTFKTFVGGNYTNFDENDLYKQKLLVELDLTNGSFEFLPFTFPQDYWLSGKKHIEFSFTGDLDKRIVFSFWGSHNIYYTENNTVKAVNAKSKFIEDNLPNIPLEGTREDRRNYMALSSHYGSIVYDPFRDVFYRLCYPYQEAESTDQIIRKARYPNKFSIMLLSSKLEIIDEILFENNIELLPSNLFVSSHGLYISSAHPDNPNSNEDSLSFRLLKVTTTGEN